MLFAARDPVDPAAVARLVEDDLELVDHGSPLSLRESGKPPLVTRPYINLGRLLLHQGKYTRIRVDVNGFLRNSLGRLRKPIAVLGLWA